MDISHSFQIQTSKNYTFDDLTHGNKIQTRVTGCLFVIHSYLYLQNDIHQHLNVAVTYYPAVRPHSVPADTDHLSAEKLALNCIRQNTE
jgi:hypothetical protein